LNQAGDSQPDDGPWAPAAQGRGPVSSAIFRTANAHKKLAGALLSDLGLYPGQEIVLMMLGEAGPTGQKDIVDYCGTHPSTVTKMLQRLEHAGLVRRRPSELDARAMVVELTPRGEQMIPRLNDLWEELERLTVADLSPNQQTRLLPVLRRLQGSIEKALDQRRASGQTSDSS
jgi:DNA-binding MarR family transcriptional regulator